VNPFPNAITLPSPLQQRLEAAAERFLDPGNAADAVDFTRPAGEPALIASDSVSWRLFKNPVALFVGGVAAVILELAEPRVRTGVWNHTTFRCNPLSRVKRTGLAALISVYGPHTQAEAMIAGVRRMHARIHGRTPAGQAYSANDPELLVWVHATAGYGILQAYHSYVHRLDAGERNSFYAEGASSAFLFGALGTPTSEQDLAMLFEKMLGKLEPSPIVFEFLEIVRRAPLLPPMLAPIQRVLVMAAIGIVPEPIRERLGLTGAWAPRPWQRHVARLVGAVADRILLRSSPAMQACRRMGLPEDYLYV
jgi:uncharacterized protein (DUF2236 family)